MFLVIIFLFVAVTPLQGSRIVFAAQGQGGNPNDQSRVLINPLTPTGGETISGNYTITASTPLVDPSQIQSLQYCVRAGETETPEEVATLAAAAEDGTTPSECVWSNMTYDPSSSTWTATVNTNSYPDGPYVIPFLLKASGVPGQKYNFVKNLTVANNVASDAAPTVALQTVNVTSPSRPTDMPLRGTVNIQGKVVDTDLASYELTVKDSNGSVVYDSGQTSASNLPSFTDLYNWDTTKNLDGSYTITLSATDQQNHSATTSITRNVDNTTGSEGGVDEGSTTAILPVTPTDGAYISGNNYLVKVTLNDPNLAFDSIVMRLQSQNGDSSSQTASSSETTTGESNSPWLRMFYDENSGYWEYSLNTTQYNDGLYWMHIRAQTESGDIVEESTASLRITNLNLDNTPPTVSAGNDQTTASSIHRSGVASDTSGIASYQWLQVNGPGQVTFSQPTAKETDISANANGNYLIQLTATDLAGNTGTSSFVLTWNDPSLVPTTNTSTGTTTTYTTPSTSTVSLAQPSTLSSNLDLASAAYYLPDTSLTTPEQTPTSQDGAMADLSLPGNNSNPAQILGGNKNSNLNWIWWIGLPLVLLGIVLVVARTFTRNKNI